MYDSTDEWTVIQTQDGLWWTKVMRGPWHVKTFTTATKRGGMRLAQRLIKRGF